jgi:RNA polymerase sigma-70 factor (ECF subfamily)
METLRCGVYRLMASSVPFDSNPGKPSVTSPGDSHGIGTPTGVEAHPIKPATVEALFRQSYKPIVQALALACGDLAAAEDATQEAFAKAWARWSQISRYDNPGAWVRRVAINKLRNAHRSRLRGEAAVGRLNSGVSTTASIPEQDPDLVLGLQRLPYKQRLCAVLYYVDGLSTAEVAEAMGIAQGSVSQHLNRARTALRAYLEATA